MSRLRIPTKDGNVSKATASGRADTEQPFKRRYQGRDVYLHWVALQSSVNSNHIDDLIVVLRFD